MDENFRLLVGWGAVLGAFVAAARLWTAGWDPNPRPGVPVFGFLALFLLLALVVVIPFVRVPSCGFPAWAAALMLLAASLPAAVATMAMGGVAPLRVCVAWLVLAVLAAVFTAFWYAASFVATTRCSAFARYYTAFLVLCVGTVVAGSPEVTGEELGVWWLLAPNPYAILVDAVPRVASVAHPDFDQLTEIEGSQTVGWYPPWDPLEVPRLTLWDAREPAWEFLNDACELDPTGRCIYPSARPDPAWPYGLAADAVLAAGAVLLARRRDRVLA